MSRMTSGCIVIDQKTLHKHIIFEIFTPFFLHVKMRPPLVLELQTSPEAETCSNDAELNSAYGKNKDRSNELTDFEKSRNQTPKVIGPLIFSPKLALPRIRITL